MAPSDLTPEPSGTRRALFFSLGQRAASILVARVTGAAAVLVSLLVLSQGLVPSDVGIVLTIQAAASVASIISTLNIEGGAIRFLPQANVAEGGILRQWFHHISVTALKVTPVLALLMMVFLTFALGQGRLSWVEMVVAILLVPAGAMVRVLTQSAHALGRVQEAAWHGLAARPLLNLIFLCLFVGMERIDISLALLAMLVATLLVAASQAIRLRQLANRPGPNARPEQQQAWQKAGLALMISALLTELYGSIVTAVSSLVLPETDVAILTIALRFALMIQMATTAIVLALSPGLSGAIGRQDWSEAQELLRSSVVMTTGVGLLAALGLTALAWPLLRIFGEAYTEGTDVLRVLVLLPLATALLGPALLVLTARGADRQIGQLSAMALGLLLSGILIGGLFGLEGVGYGLVLSQWTAAALLTAKASKMTGLRLAIWHHVRPSPRRPMSKREADQDSAG